MKWSSIILCILGLMLVSNSLLAQEKELKKADNLYRNYQYNAAIPYYEKYLQLEPRKRVLSVKTKLAYSYRMANKSEKAEKLYAQIVEEPKARPIVAFYYGEMLMANGKYDEAKIYFKRYLVDKPEDEKCLALLSSCDKVKNIKSQFLDIELSSLDINTSADDFSPMFYEDGITFLSDQGEKGSTYGWTGRSYLKLYKTIGGTHGDFQEKEAFGRKINEKAKNTGPVSIARNGESLIITRNSYTPAKNNRYNLQLFELKRKGDTWGRGEVMPFCRNDRNYMHPALTWTGDTLYFVTDRGGGFGGTDIFMTYRTPRGWKTPINLGNIINSTGHEAFPFIHVDGTLYFASKGHPGFGGFDIFKAVKENGVYTKIINLGIPVNSPKDDTGFILSDDKKIGYFASNRKAGNDDIYHFAISSTSMKGIELAKKPHSGEQVMGTGVAANTRSFSNKLETAKTISQLQANTAQKTIELEGKIVDEATQEPISDAVVYLENSSNGKLRKLDVDKDGTISTLLELDQNYSIVVNKDGYRNKSILLSTHEVTKKLTPTFNLVKR